MFDQNNSEKLADLRILYYWSSSNSNLQTGLKILEESIKRDNSHH